MTPLEAPIHACTSRRRSALPWTFILLVALAALSTTDLQAQEWRFDAIDQASSSRPSSCNLSTKPVLCLGMPAMCTPPSVNSVTSRRSLAR